MSKIDPKSLARQLEGLIDHSAGGGWSAGRRCADRETNVPAMDMYETAEWLTIELELPGIRREAIEVYSEGQSVTVSAIKVDAGPCADPVGPKVDYQQVERKYGRFYREIRFPVPCNTRDCQVRYLNGVLHMAFKKVTDRRGERRRLTVE